jgi:transposase
MIKIWFYGYATKTYSSRKIEEKLYKDVAFIYLAGMQKPDFKAISEFRRKNISELRNSFVDILQICHRLGLTGLGEISIDSKVVKANAAPRRTYDEKELIKEREELEKAIQEYLEKANNTDVEEDEKYGPEKRGNELPKDIRKKEDRVKKMKRIVEQLKQAQEKLGESSKKKINLTDEDAQFQKDGARLISGYRTQVAVDSKEQIIVANDVTNDQCDSSQLLPMVEQTCENVKELKKEDNNDEKNKLKVIADSRYNSESNLAELETKEEIDPYIPDMREQAKKRVHKTPENSPFYMSKFNFNQEENYFECPVGKKLNYIKQKKYRNRLVSIYTCKECNNCHYFGKCTTDKNGRSIWVSEYAHLVKRMRQKLSTSEGKKIYGLRKITVEPVLGNLSQNLGFREFLLRGKEKVKGEFSLMCTAHNILKMAKYVRCLGKTLKEILTIPEPVPLIDSS